MARIEYIKHRLDNWALWKARERGGGLGYATTSVLLMDRVDQSREINLYSTIDETDAALTNAAVESLKPTRPQLYERIYWIYIDDLGIRGAARRGQCAESTIKASLDQADHALQAWFTAKAEQDAARRALLGQQRSLST